MDFGDEGHILVSNAVADVLNQLSTWRPSLHDLGEAKTKHGLRVHLYNLYTPKAGNPALPQKLRQARIAWRRKVLAFVAIAALAAGLVLAYIPPKASSRPPKPIRRQQQRSNTQTKCSKPRAIRVARMCKAFTVT
jgi:hypothetical protein